MNPDENRPPTEGSTGKAGDQLSPGQKIGGGRYTLIRALGRGGMGVVWLARDGRLNEDVALKLLPPEIRSDPVSLDDLRRETLKSRRLTHPNIIRIHDLFEADGEATFISMEYVDGGNLTDLRLQRPARLFDWEYLRPLARQLCDALEYAHSEKVIHRDLKPGNMMLDSRGRLKLADFGIAATVSDSVSRVSLRQMTSGTPTFMSPQQMEGQMPRVTDDIYALGATLYELLTSRPPFHSGDIVHQVKNVAPQPMVEKLADLELQNEIPADVAAMVMACLAKDPEQRPQSARAVAEWIGLGTGTDATSPTGAKATAKPLPGTAPVADVEPLNDEAPASNKTVWLGVAAAVLLIGALCAVYVAKQKSSARNAPAATNLPFADTRSVKSPAAAPAPAGPGESQWAFNGVDFTGLRVPDQNPFWSVTNGMLSGRQPVASSKRGYNLETTKDYQDFILEADVRHTPGADAGIYFRKDHLLRCALGYYRGFEQLATANIRNDNLSDALGVIKNPESMAKPNDWNRLRIEVKGQHFKTWLNGELASDYETASVSGAGPISLRLYGKPGTGFDLRNFSIVGLAPENPNVMSPAGPAGTLDTSFNPGAGFNAGVRSVAIQADGKIVVGGEFSEYNNRACTPLLRLNADGSRDELVTPRVEGKIRALTDRADERILLGGDFTKVNNGGRTRVAQLNSNMSLDGRLKTAEGPNHEVFCMAVDQVGRVIIGGQFTTVDGTPRNRVARLTAGGQLDPSFNPGSGADATVWSVAVTREGSILVGGDFKTFNGAARHGLVRLRTDGVLDPTFDAKIVSKTPNQVVRAVLSQPDGRILVGGPFTGIGGTTRGVFARLNLNGTFDGTFKTVVASDGWISFIRRRADGKILIGGAFAGINNTPCQNVAMLEADGSLAPGFKTDIEMDAPVWAGGIQSDGKIVIAGKFTRVNGVERNHIARLNGDATQAARAQ